MIQKIKAWAQEAPHRQALVIDDKSYTYCDLLRMMNQIRLDGSIKEKQHRHALNKSLQHLSDCLDLRLEEFDLTIFPKS